MLEQDPRQPDARSVFSALLPDDEYAVSHSGFWQSLSMGYDTQQTLPPIDRACEV